MQNEFERTKQEILAAQSAQGVEGETDSDISVQCVGGKKKGKVKGLGSLGRTVNASNANLYAQLQNERNKNKRMRKELSLLMKHVYKKSSLNEQSSREDNQAAEDENEGDSDNENGSDSDPDNVNESDSDPNDWYLVVY
ncbi:hypothetical protein H5410_021608 [Solanum commersonii]|uniref:Uncharacterized protein n=1 Tax=Solanum commersonii TaxID=4109 RepID=A0A9J5ZEF9_SOLCO|nr:hypothetical protein H5410_021608 [Solanum commersonii]